MSEPEPSAATRTRDLKNFWFLVDAPMLSDDSLIERLHDAVLRPERILEEDVERTNKTAATKRQYGLEGKKKGEVPFVFEMALKGTFRHDVSHSDSTGHDRKHSIPRTPERLLEEVVAFYLRYFPNRVLTVDPVAGTVQAVGVEGDKGYAYLDEICNQPGPRPIVVLDCPAGSKFIPMAAEFVDGDVVVIVDALADAFSTPEEPLPRFGRTRLVEKPARIKIWQAQISAFKGREAMYVLEDTGKSKGGQRIQWIDFRLPWQDQADPSPLHLHVVPGGRYSMGTFAHAFINRGFHQGARIVGTLKSGGDINVLAIYER